MYIFKREFNKQLHYQLIRQNLSLMDEFYFFAERMAYCCHLQAHLQAHLSAHLQAHLQVHLSAHLQAHLQAYFVYATLI